MDIQLLLTKVVQLAQQAGSAILSIYTQQTAPQVYVKSDASPLTEADLQAHDIIISGLKKLTPELPVLSEENVISFQERRQWQRYWLVDPLDGTKEFIEKNGEFTVNIALVDQHQPMLGVVYAPVLDCCYFAATGHGAYRQTAALRPEKIHTELWRSGVARVVASRHHAGTQLKPFLERLGNYTVLYSGSALKCCRIAEGAADVYPRLSPTSEWDTAAAQCVLTEAGGAVLDTAGKPLCYNTKESLENPAFLAVGDKDFNWLQFL